MTEACLKVFISGLCAHPLNAKDRMHVCARFLNHGDAVHQCLCGKEWTDAGLTNKQYGEIAFTKAVE